MGKRSGIFILIVGILILTTSCAGLPHPSVYSYPTRGQAPDQISRDRAECMLWAKDVTGFDPAASAGIGAIMGGLGGAVLGALGGLIFGEAGRGAAIGALGGGVGGGIYNYSKDKEGYERAYAACMQGRGYTVR